MEEVISTVMQKYETKCRQTSTLESFLAFWIIKVMALRFSIQNFSSLELLIVPLMKKKQAGSFEG